MIVVTMSKQLNIHDNNEHGNKISRNSEAYASEFLESLVDVYLVPRASRA